MRFLSQLIPSLILLGTSLVDASGQWSFDEGSISINSKGGDGFKEKLSAKNALPKPVSLGPADTLKILLTATEDSKGKKPHQAFLLLQDQDTNLETSFLFTVKDTGKAKADFTQEDIPIQLLTSTKPLQGTLLLASFGSSKPYSNIVFELDIKLDPNTPMPKYEKPLRYGKMPEIHHIFKDDAKSPPKIVSLFFVFAVLATLPILLGAAVYLGANLDHMSKAFSAVPVSHSLFYGSILAMEGIFFLYYYSWSLFQTLPAAGVVGSVTFMSGSKALSEVQSRRLAGER